MAEPAIELRSSPVQGSVSIDGRPVVLTQREYLLLAYFVDHPGFLLTRQQILHEVWGLRYEGGPRTVDIHVSRLRRKLGPTLQLDTLRTLGYRFGSRNEQQACSALEAVK
jgi:DNA-binding response OmpR family regulator